MFAENTLLDIRSLVITGRFADSFFFHDYNHTQTVYYVEHSLQSLFPSSGEN